LKIKFQGELSTLTEGINILSHQLGFDVGSGGFEVDVKRNVGDLKIVKDGMKATISFERDIHFYRGLGLLLEAISKGKENFVITETPQFLMNGPMFDCSRNAVMNPETVKSMLRKMAVMGLDTLMLYTEDTYELAARPYFGYLRGRYTYEELLDLDNYASKLGIEIIPCIQTLAHLEQALKWGPMAKYRDTDDIILADTKQTYELIEEMIVAASKPFRSKRIHLGMDEAHQLGLGKYLDLYGYHKRFDIMTRHLEKVLSIAQKYGLEPIIWSDMFFKAVSEIGYYYDVDSEFTEDVIAKIPKGVCLVYWDYYNNDKSFYKEWIKRHKSLGTEPIFAGGIWNWVGMCTQYGRTFQNTNAALEACKEEGVKEVFATVWTNDGGENNHYTALLGLQLFAEHGYARELSEEKLRERFEFCNNAPFDAFMGLKDFDEVPGTEGCDGKMYNPSKYLLWQDLLLGLFDVNVAGLSLSQHYCNLAEQYRLYKQQNKKWAFVFDVYESLASLLAVKAELGLRINQYYHSDDRDALKSLVEKDLAELSLRTYTLREKHRELWHITNKPFGWEVLDIRYGGLINRIDTTSWRLTSYLEGELNEIPELEEKKLRYDRGSIEQYSYRRIATPSSEF